MVITGRPNRPRFQPRLPSMFLSVIRAMSSACFAGLRLNFFSAALRSFSSSLTCFSRSSWRLCTIEIHVGLKTVPHRLSICSGSWTWLMPYFVCQSLLASSIFSTFPFHLAPLNRATHLDQSLRVVSSVTYPNPRQRPSTSLAKYTSLRVPNDLNRPSTSVDVTSPARPPMKAR